MKTSFAVLLCAASALSAKAQGVVVYQSDLYKNTDSSYAVLPVTSGVQTGDEVQLAGSGRFITGFTFNYWANGLPVDATAEVKFYDSTGGTVGSLLYDTGSFSISSTTGKQLIFSQADLSGGFQGVDDMTWTVTFNFNSGSAGLFLGNAIPTVGASFADYSTFAPGTGWQLLGNDGAPNKTVNFVSSITAAPEPSTIALLGMGGVAGLMLIRRRK